MSADLSNGRPGLHAHPCICAWSNKRQLVSCESIGTRQEAAEAVAGELVSDCTRKGHAAKSSQGSVAAQLASGGRIKRLRSERKLKKLPSGEEKGWCATVKGKPAMLEPMDVRADSGGGPQ